MFQMDCDEISKVQVQDSIKDVQFHHTGVM